LTSASNVIVQSVLQLAWTATAASLIVCVSFALALRAFDNAGAARDEHRPAAAFRGIVITAVPAAICLSAIAAAILVLAS
jgi:hypothetical protein